jgi:hypothetical protein
VAGAVGAYIAGAIYFTSSAAFANPAVTVAVPGFLAGQITGAVMAALLVRWLFAPNPVDVSAVVAAHGLSLPQVPR